MPSSDRRELPVSADSFDAYYFAHCCGRPYQRDDHWLTFFGKIADRIVADIAPARVLDAGCAMGLLVEALRERGVEAWGVDLSSYAIDHVADAAKPFCQRASITEPFGRRVDLIVSIEVVEHMPAAEADSAIANFCAHTDDVLFSSSPHDHREPTHVNVRPAEDWAETFARHGFFRDTDFDATFISPWAVRFRKSTDPIHRVVRGFARRLARLEHERYEMRAFTAEAQGKQAAAEQMTAHVRETLMGEIESLRRHLAAVEAEVEPVRRELDRLRHDLHASREEARAYKDTVGFLQETVRNMERSIFWRIRQLFR